MYTFTLVALTWMNLENIAKWKKPAAKNRMLYDSIDMKKPEQGNPQRKKADQWLPEAGVGGKGE